MDEDMFRKNIYLQHILHRNYRTHHQFGHPI